MRWIAIVFLLLLGLLGGPRLAAQELETFDRRQEAQAQYEETRRNAGIIIVLVIAGGCVLVYQKGWIAGLGPAFLCDSCKFNSDRYCSKPDRPNATSCGDYKALSV